MVVQTVPLLLSPPHLVFQRDMVPVTDLGALGDIGKQLEFPRDVSIVLAYLCGAGPAGPKLVPLTATGALPVANTGSGLSHIDPHEGTVAAGAQTTVTFVQTCSAIMLLLDDEDWTVEHSLDKTTFDTGFTVRANERVTIDLATALLRLTNTGQSPARFRTWGLFFPPLPPAA